MAQGLSPAIVEETRVFWERHFGESLTSEDAGESIRNIAGFFDLLARWDAEARTPPTDPGDSAGTDAGNPFPSRTQVGQEAVAGAAFTRKSEPAAQRVLEHSRSTASALPPSGVKVGPGTLGESHGQLR